MYAVVDLHRNLSASIPKYRIIRGISLEVFTVYHIKNENGRVKNSTSPVKSRVKKSVYIVDNVDKM